MQDSISLRNVILCGISAVTLGKLASWHRRVKDLPPGPRKLPFIDNLLNMPDGLDWVKFAEIGKEHNSDIIHLSALGHSIVVLNTFDAARELLDNRSGIYSSRPNSVMMNELSGMGNVLTLVPYGDRFRTSRRMFMKHFGFGSAKISQPREIFYARRCLHQLLETPDDFLQHIQHLVGSLSLSITYGLKARPTNDDYVGLSSKLMATMSDIAGAGMFMVDVIPSLKYLPKWFPGASFQKVAEDCSRLVVRVRETLFQVTEEVMETSNFTPSFVSEHLRELDPVKDAQDIDILKDLSMTVYLGAADTTWSALGTFMLAMVCYPDVQKKLQQELDGVLSGKLPEHNDIEQLPYLTAVFMEVLRWKPTVPIGIPHMNIAEDAYKGYVVPKDSIVLANQWAMSYDPIAYPEPSEFKPERFLKGGELDEAVRNPIDIAFGFGRRTCPGRHIAQSTFMITAASILSTFDLRMKTDENGELIRPTQDYHLSSICHPKDFPCLIVPRSSEAKELIYSWAAAEGDNP